MVAILSILVPFHFLPLALGAEHTRFEGTNLSNTSAQVRFRAISDIRPRPEAVRSKEPHQATPTEKRWRLLLASPRYPEGTASGRYADAMIAGIEMRWLAGLARLGAQGYGVRKAGRVVLQFDLHQDGSVTEMKVLESTAGDYLSIVCQKAVLDCARFATWPADVRKEIGADARAVELIFNFLPDER